MANKRDEVSAKIPAETHKKWIKAKGELEFKKGEQTSLYKIAEEFTDIAYEIWRKEKGLTE